MVSPYNQSRGVGSGSGQPFPRITTHDRHLVGLSAVRGCESASSSPSQRGGRPADGGDDTRVGRRHRRRHAAKYSGDGGRDGDGAFLSAVGGSVFTKLAGGLELELGVSPDHVTTLHPCDCEYPSHTVTAGAASWPPVSHRTPHVYEVSHRIPPAAVTHSWTRHVSTVADIYRLSSIGHLPAVTYYSTNESSC